MADEQKPWWQTIPGFLTAAAAVITAVTGLLVALNQAGFLNRGDEQPAQVSTPQPEAAPPSGAAPNAATPAAADHAAAPAKSVAPPAAAQPATINLLAPENGGHLVIGSGEHWKVTIDGRDDGTYISGGDSIAGEEAVYAFKDKQIATFDTFALLIPDTGDNIKKFELLAANDAPTGPFRSIGQFETKNTRFFDDPYQEFKFEPVTARYLKFKLMASHGQGYTLLSEFRLQGRLGE